MSGQLGLLAEEEGSSPLTTQRRHGSGQDCTPDSKDAPAFLSPLLSTGCVSPKGRPRRAVAKTASPKAASPQVKTGTPPAPGGPGQLESCGTTG